MGSFLSSIDQERRELPQLQFFRRYTLSKLREHHAKFKALCDTFSVDDSEFYQMFGEHPEVFELLDTDNNLLIDGLQLFAGLILFSGSHFESKLYFLFDLFDFNGFNSLSVTDLQFLVLSCCTAAHKVLGLRTPVGQQTVRDLISREFLADRRINISEMVRWASNFHEVRCFFELIQRKAPKLRSFFSQTLYASVNSIKSKQAGPPIWRKSPSEAMKKYEQWTEGLSRRLQELDHPESQPFRNSDVAVELDWVFGIRSHDVKRPYISSHIGGREVLIYSVAKVIVLAFIKTNKQVHYTSHENQVISLCSTSRLVASGQLADSPAIHIWDMATQRTKKILKGCHKKGVYILRFTNLGELLCSCGLQPEPVVVVYGVATGEVLFSTFMKQTITQVSGVVSFIDEEDHQSETILFGLREVCCLKVLENTQFQTRQLFQLGNLSNITCGLALKYNRSNRYLKGHQLPNQAVCAVLTGHVGGELCHWQQGLEEYSRRVLKTYPSEVVEMEPLNDTIIVATFSSFVDIWSIELTLLRTVDITSLGLKLFSYEVIHVAATSKQELIVMTNRGDMIRLNNIDEPEKELKPTRVNIIRLPGKQRCIGLLEKDGSSTVYVGGAEGIVYGLDTKTHQLVDTWNLNEPILAMDACLSQKGGCLIVVAISRNCIYMRVDQQEVQKPYQCSNTINDLKVMNNGQLVLVACEDRYLHILSSNSKGYFSHAKKIDIDSCIPKSIHVIQQKALICTADNNLYLLSLSDHKYRLLDEKSEGAALLSTTHARLKYTLKEEQAQYRLPVVSNPKVVLMGSPDGDMCYSRDKQALSSRIVGCVSHLNSALSDILVTPDLRVAFATGIEEQAILSYRLRLTCQKSLLEPAQQTTKQSSSYDELLTRQIYYCLYTNNNLSVLHDQHMLVRGIKNPTLSKLLRGMMDDWKDTNKLVNKHSPSVNLKLDYVYGIQTFERRDCICFVDNPKRFLYYVAKVAVLYNPQSNTQKFYQGHNARITCLNLLGECRVASGEAAYFPCIRVWNYDTLTTLRVLETGHRWGITHIASQQGIVLSCGFDSKIFQNDDKQTLTFSLQLTDSQTGQVMGYQKSGTQPIYSMGFDPLDEKKFVTTGDNNVTYWVVEPLGIQRKAIYTIDEEIATVCESFSYKMGSSNRCQLLIGTRSGSIYLLTTTKTLLLMRKKAHTKPINCLKLAKQDLLISSGEDEYIRIWNGKFECIYEQEMRRIDFFKELAKLNSENKYFQKAVERNLSVQSISVWPHEGALCLLMATRNGQVMELTLNDQCTETKYNLYMRNHCSQFTGQQRPYKRLFFSLHPRFDILLSLGEDQNLFLWDTQKNKIIASKVLGYVAHPTCVKFNRDGDILVIGFSDGLVIFLDSKIIRSNQGKNDEKYIVPTLSLVQKHKQEKKAAVLNIEFSQSGQHLAISFNRSYSDRSRHDPTLPNDPSYISLFINRTRDKAKSIVKGNQQDKLYSWFTDVRCQQGEKTYHTRYGSLSSMASHFMSFAETEGHTYLLIYYQLVDSNNIRLNHNTDSDYVVWDVNTSTIVVNLESIAGLQWSRLNVPNSINCRYQLYSDLVCRKRVDQQPRNNNLIKPQITSMVMGKHQLLESEMSNLIFLGSLNGDIHVAWAKSLDYGGSFSQAPKEEDMYLAKSYVAHNSFVDCMQVCTSTNQTVFEQYLFTNGIEDQCIAKWRVCYQPMTTPPEEGEDIFGDVPSKHELDTTKQAIMKRQLLNQLKTRTQPLYKSHNKHPLRMQAILGRNSSSYRNSLFLDCKGDIVYAVGCNVVVMRPEDCEQQILYTLDGQLNCADMISALTMANNRRLIAVGTQGKISSVSLWEVRSKLFIKKIDLPQLQMVLKLAFSDSLNYLLVYGLDHQHTGVLYIVDIDREEVLSLIKGKYQAAWVIKSMLFMPNTFEEFVTCGVNHYCSWHIKGSCMNYTRQSLCESKETHKEMVLFSLLMIAERGYVMCCDAGYIYLQSLQHKPLSRVKAHDGWCLALAWEEASGTLVSGGRDGKVGLWKIDNNQLVQLTSTALQDHFVLQPSQREYSDEVESVDIRNSSVLVGTRNGSVYLLGLSQGQQFARAPAQAFLALHDMDTTTGMFFSDSEEQLYEVTRGGVLSVWNINGLRCTAQHSFGRAVTDMLSCNRQHVFFVVFEREIVAINKGDSSLEPMQGFRVEFSSPIRSVVLSANHKILAASIDKSSDKKPRICLYDISSGPSFKLLFETFLVQSPEYIDFSSNNRLLLCKNPDKDVIIDLNTWAVLAAHTEGLEWTNQGLKRLNRLSSITKIYSQEAGNAIRQVVELFENFYAFTDQIGTVRVFYKAKQESEAELMLSNAQHLNHIKLCVRSADSTFLATSSTVDRSIILWKIDPKFK